MSAAIALHVLAAVIWVGGMFFAYVVLRPSAGQLGPAVRFALWARVFSRFFVWVWASVLVLLSSGFAMVYLGFGGMAGIPPYVRAMMAIGIAMTAIYLYLYFLPWRAFRQSVADSDWPRAGKHLGRIRIVVAINLVLGLATVAIAAGGRYFG